MKQQVLGVQDLLHAPPALASCPRNMIPLHSWAGERRELGEQNCRQGLAVDKVSHSNRRGVI